MISTRPGRSRLAEWLVPIRFTLRGAVKRLAKLFVYRNKIIILVSLKDLAVVPEIKKRAKFYLGKSRDPRFMVVQKLPPLAEDNHILQCSDDREFNPRTHRLAKNKYRVNHLIHVAGWDWWKFANSYLQYKPDIARSKLLFQAYTQRLKNLGFTKCYVFGTGPSLAEAINRDWSDGYRVVCNTIVKDPNLFHHINPHFIVAGDALYHYSDSPYATAFRRDLHKRLQESSAHFVYPSLFDMLVKREFVAVNHQLIAVPRSSTRKTFNNGLNDIYEIPRGGNVLPSLLIPIACSLAKDIYLWGFDGRSPNDSDVPFWRNSAQHSYSELLPRLKHDYPGFFKSKVPNNDSTSYIKTVHGDTLDSSLTIAEEAGYSFTMLHHTWTPTLSKRVLSTS